VLCRVLVKKVVYCRGERNKVFIDFLSPKKLKTKKKTIGDLTPKGLDPL